MTAGDTGPIMIVGAGGMLGNALLHDFTRRGLQAIGTVRRAPAADDPWFAGLTVLPDMDLDDPTGIEAAIEATRPRWIVNCAARRNLDPDEAGSAAAMLAINARLPHRLADVASLCSARLVHISTDGVFDGTSAPYDEHSPPSPADLYGRSKLAGEPVGDHVLTLRLSLIGRSPAGQGTLVDWLLGLPLNAGITGYARSVFSGLPVHRIARFLAESVMARSTPPHGLLHVAGPPTSKADLIRLVLARAGRGDVVVTDDGSVAIDRTLTSVRRTEMDDPPPLSWAQMVDEMFDFYAQRGIAD
jgi:dTDP-4-dehydrorhamnose reductase